jgi:hypothetical protein
MLGANKRAARHRRRMQKVNRINNLLEAEREGLTIPQLRAKRRKERTSRIIAARRRHRALSEMDIRIE